MRLIPVFLLMPAWLTLSCCAMDAGSLFARHFDLLGGTQELAKIGPVRIQGYRVLSKETNSFALSIRPPGNLLLEQAIAGKTLALGRGSDRATWASENGARRPPGDHEKRELVGLGIALHPPQQLFLRERMGEAVCENARLRTVPGFALGKKNRRHYFPRLVFGSEEGRLIRVETLMLSGYKRTGQILLPHELHCLCGARYVVTNVVFGAELPESLFASRDRAGWLSGLMPNPMGAEMGASMVVGTNATPYVLRHPAPAKTLQKQLTKLPRFDPTSGGPGQVSLQGADLRELPLDGFELDLLHSDFDTRTLWPASLPAKFDPEQIMELGKNPGLGVRELHKRGVTGKGVGIGIIDFPLLTAHQEYAARLRLYEEIGSPVGMSAHMHGTAVASIAAGTHCGVAPEADIYFVASRNFTASAQGGINMDWSMIARSIERLLDVSASLPEDRRIRVISISMGWTPGETGADRMTDVLERAAEAKVFVVSTSLRRTHVLLFDGLNRPALADPEDPNSYGPGSWWANTFWSGEFRFAPGKRLCVPMDARTTASPRGASDYVHYDYAGWSWSVPWIAGLYALSCQAEPGMTPELFFATALTSGSEIQLRDGNEVIRFGMIANPVALIEALTRKSRNSE